MTRKAEKQEMSKQASGKQVANYTFQKAEIIFSGGGVISLPSKSPVIFDPSGHDGCHLYVENGNHVNIKLNGVVMLDDSKGCKRDIKVSLYKKGQRRAVVSKAMTLDDDLFLGLSAEVNFGKRKLEIGAYRMEISNAVHVDDVVQALEKCTFEFYIVDAGEADKMEVSDVVFSICHEGVEGDGQHLQLSADISITQELPYGMPLTACFYDESMTLLEKKEIVVENNLSTQVCHIDFGNSPCWIPGNYKCVVTSVGKGRWLTDFTIDDHLQVVSEHHQKNPKTRECFFLDELGQESPRLIFKAWETMSRKAGFVRIKQHALKVLMIDKCNAVRTENGVANLTVQPNHLVFGIPSEELRQTLYALNDIESSEFSFSYVNAAELGPESPSDGQLARLEDLMNDKDEHTFCFYNLGAILPLANQFAEMLFENLSDTEEECHVYLLGNHTEIDTILKSSPGLKSLFPDTCVLTADAYSAVDAARSIEREVIKNNLHLSPEAMEKIVCHMRSMEERGLLSRWHSDSSKHFFTDSLMPAFQDRMLEESVLHPDNASQLITIKAVDVDLRRMVKKDESGICMEALNSMVGLTALKQALSDMFVRVKFDELRRSRGYLADGCNYHMVFTGNPGTGKTTVAKLMAPIFHQMGVISKGGLIVADRTTLVGKYIGHTEDKIKQLLSDARGNVLFIDEAYSLCDDTNDRRDYGYRAVECLLATLSQKNPDMVVILAGYKDEMERLMGANTGLMSRFPNVFHFDDYTSDELHQIAVNKLDRDGFHLTPEADRSLHKAMEQMVAAKYKDFSNARLAEQFVDNYIIQAMANRVMAGDLTDNGVLELVQLADIEKAYEVLKMRMQGSSAKRPVMGFGSPSYAHHG